MADTPPKMETHDPNVYSTILKSILRIEKAILHICHFFYTTAIWGLEILHLKVRKFATIVASPQNSVKQLMCKIILHFWNDKLCLKIYTLSVILHFTLLHAVLSWDTFCRKFTHFQV